jgi:hypothetical protein
MTAVYLSSEYFPDPTKGRPVFNGSVYIGEPDLDPQIAANQKQVTLRLEDGSSVLVGQPLLTGAGGVVLYNSVPVAQISVDGAYSLKVLNSNGVQVYYIPNREGFIGAGDVTYNSITVEQKLNNLDVASFTELRAITSSQLVDGDMIRVSGFPAAWEVKTGSVTDNGRLLVFNDDAGRYAESTSVKSYAEIYGATGDGTTDDTTFLAAGLLEGIVELEDGKTYFITSRLLASIASSGFRCDGQATLLMSHAGFNATTYAGLAANSVAFQASSLDDIHFDNINIVLETGTGIRTCQAVSISNCTNIKVNVEASGFKECELGVISVDSIIDGRCQVYVHDCEAVDNTLPSIQLTGLWVDNNRTSNIYSKDVHFISPKFKNITMGAAAIAAYGYQTDGMTLGGGATSGGGGCTIDVIDVENVYEGLDIQSSEHVIGGMNARDIYGFPLKLVHAGRNNIIGDVHAINTDGAIVVIAGTSTASESADNNVIGNVTGVGIGDLSGAGQPKAAIFFSGSAATLKPNNNTIKSVKVVGSSSMTEMVLDQAGTGNKVLNVDGLGTNGVGSVDSGQLANDHVFISKLPRSSLRATRSVDQTGVTTGTRIAFDQADFDLQSELDTSNGQFRSVAPMVGSVSGCVRVSGFPTGNYLEARVSDSSGTIAAVRQRNDSGSNQEMILPIQSTEFKLTNRDQFVQVLIYHDTGGSITISSAYTNMSISEIG